MKVVLSGEDRLRSWELLIDTVDKTDIPIEVVHGINLVFNNPVDGEDERDIDLRQLRRHGFSNDDLEAIMQQVMIDFKDNIKTVNFYLNVEYIADLIEKQTNQLLKGVK